MTDIIVEIEGGMVTANLEERTITGKLIPIGEPGRTNIGRFTIEHPDDIDITDAEADPSIISHNLDHVAAKVVGRATRVWKQPDGVYATYTIAKTRAGDEYLADATSPTGKRKALSGEFGPCRIRDGKLVPGEASLWGSAGVPAGAFPSAMVLAADTPEAPTVELESVLGPDEGGHLTVASTTLPADITVNTPAGESAVYTPEPNPAEDNQEEGSTVTANEVLAGAPAPAPVPQTLIPSAPLATIPERSADLGAVYAAIASVRSGASTTDEAVQVLAALTDIKISGANTLTVGGGAIRENWVGRVWQGKEYVRKFIALAKLGTDISAAGKKGYKLFRGTAASPVTRLGGDWAGNKAEVPSGNGFTTGLSSTLRRFAFAADIAREFYDLPGGAEVVEAFIAFIIEDYAMWSDEAALADILTVAAWNGVGNVGANTSGIIAPNTYPDEYPDAMGMLIQGVLAVNRAKDTASYAIVNAEAYEQLVYTPKDLVPEFVTFTLNTEGSGAVDGKVTITEAPDSFFGEGSVIEPGTPAVAVGAKNAIEFDELGATPLRIDALDIAHGGIDKAVHGYLQTFVVRPEAVVLVGTANVP